MGGGEYFAQAINGPSENEIYLVGSENFAGYPARADFWDGQTWRRLLLPATSGRLTNIYVESEERIWLCGAKGTLLVGNARDGFIPMNHLGATQLILSLTKFRNIYYIGTSLGLFQFDLGKPTRAFSKVRKYRSER